MRSLVSSSETKRIEFQTGNLKQTKTKPEKKILKSQQAHLGDRESDTWNFAWYTVHYDNNNSINLNQKILLTKKHASLRMSSV